MYTHPYILDFCPIECLQILIFFLIMCLLEILLEIELFYKFSLRLHFFLESTNFRFSFHLRLVHCPRCELLSSLNLFDFVAIDRWLFPKYLLTNLKTGMLV